MEDNMADGRLSASGIAKISVGLIFLTYKNREYNHIPYAFLSKMLLFEGRFDFEGRLDALHPFPHQLIAVNVDSGVSLPRCESQLSQLFCNLGQNI